MNNLIPLKKACDYSRERINSSEVTLDNFITTDNLLQNKNGITLAIGLPPQGNSMPKYSKNNILVANIRPYLKKIWFADKTGGCSADVLVYKVKNGFDPKFIYYAMFRDDFFLHTMKGSKGTKMPRGDKKQMMEFLIPDFRYSTQQKIASVLSSLDAKIELNNKINTELEAMAKTLYDYWFIQFDFPNEQGKPYKSSGGKMVYNQKLKREIPKGWNVAYVGDILKTELGGTPSTKNEKYWNGNIPWLNSGEIANFPIIEAEENITSEAIKNSATSLMPVGTCVLSITRHLRPSVLAIDGCANQSVVGIYESKKYKYSYIFPYLKNEIPRLMSLRTGAQQPHINKGIVDESLIVEPNDQILEKYYEKVNSLYKRIIKGAFQNQQLTELRDWLLPMLMNGQVTLRQAHGKLDNLEMAEEPINNYKNNYKV